MRLPGAEQHHLAGLVLGRVQHRREACGPFAHRTAGEHVVAAHAHDQHIRPVIDIADHDGKNRLHAVRAFPIGADRRLDIHHATLGIEQTEPFALRLGRQLHPALGPHTLNRSNGSIKSHARFPRHPT